MTAPEIYRKWISDYKFEKQITSKEPINDGDILDWLAEKQAKNISINPLLCEEKSCNHDWDNRLLCDEGIRKCVNCGYTDIA